MLGLSPHVRSHRVDACWISTGVDLVEQGFKTLGDHINEEMAQMRKIMSTKNGTGQHRASKEGKKIKKSPANTSVCRDLYSTPALLVYSLKLVNELSSHRAQLHKLLPLH